MEGKLDGQFPVDIFSAGSGTSSNMNVNEVIAVRAREMLGGSKSDLSLAHPNDHVNMGQSTNNVFPSSIRVSALPLIKNLIARTRQMESTLNKKARRFDKIIKSGRTHLQDAVPIRLGQVFGAFAYAISKDRQRLKETIPFISELGVGGNAVGTGINTHPRFRALIIKHLNRQTGRSFDSADAADGIDAQQKGQAVRQNNKIGQNAPARRRAHTARPGVRGLRLRDIKRPAEAETRMDFYSLKPVKPL